MVDEVSTHVQDEVNTTGSPDHIHEMLAKVDDPVEVSDGGFTDDLPQEQERPEWLPEKFSSPQELANAYQQLEKQFHSNEEVPQESQEQTLTSEQEVEIEGTTTSQVHQILDERGLSLQSFQDEYNETGELSKNAYEALDEAGIGREVVDTWVQGQEALADQNITTLYDSVGGEESYNRMIEWANENLEPWETDAFNKQIENLDATSQFAVLGLQARYQNSEGGLPALIAGGVSEDIAPRYESLAQITSAMSNPLYEKDPAFRAKVAQRLNNSTVL